jgi:hypothetical protein
MAIQKSLLLSVALLVLFCVANIAAHSWLDCADYRYDSSKTFINSAVKTNCDGFARGYTAREVNPDGSLYKITSKNSSLPACRRPRTAYSSQYPMPTARPGETLTMAWTPNGHTEWHKPKPPPFGPRDVYLKWTGIPNKELTTIGQVRQAKNFMAPVQFDKPCHNRKTCAQLDSSGGICTWDYTLPTNLPPGRYHFVWWWPFNFAGDNVTEEYVSCFDVMVSGTPVTQSRDTSKCAVGGVGKYPA